MESVREYEIGLFSIEGDFQALGYHNGEHWNGFACPYFEKEEAIKILKECTDRSFDDGGYLWKFDKNDDKFYVTDYLQGDENGNPGLKDYFDAKDIMVDGKVLHVYGIGNGSWTWDLESCVEINGKYFTILPNNSDEGGKYIKWHNFTAICIDDENLFYELQITKTSEDNINHFSIEVFDLENGQVVNGDWKELEEVISSEKEIEIIKQLLINYSDLLIAR